jgi:ESS family glutamate:Na+ symporter
MGRSYDAAVVSAGFGGISLGSTPTAMANIAAVTQGYGASHLAFIIVPLVCAFFIDLANALAIPLFLAHFWLRARRQRPPAASDAGRIRRRSSSRRP